MNSDSIISVYSDARSEYTKQLCVFLVPSYFKFFIELLEKAKEATYNEPKKALWQFQTYLNEIHDWNMEKVNNEINTIYNNSGCDYLEDLLTAVFIAHTKVLTAIRLNSTNKKINITVPKVEHFLFKVLCECSKLLWSSTFLFRDGISSIEKQQNYRSIEQLLNEGILQAIRSLVPVKSILRDFVKNDESENNEHDNDDSDEEDEKPVTKPIIEETVEKSEIEEHSETIIKEPIKLNEELTSEPLPELEHHREPEPEPEPMNHVIHSEIQSTEINESKPVNDIIIPQNQVINIEERPIVQFADFDAVFDSDNPMESDMIFDPKDEDSDETPDLEIIDTEGTPLDEGLDFDSLDNTEKSENISNDDYEVLV